jgi:hypothetical protein
VHTHFHDSPQVVTDEHHEPSMETVSRLNLFMAWHEMFWVWADEAGRFVPPSSGQCASNGSGSR